MVENKDNFKEDFGPDDRRFLAFENKTLDEQADEITKSLLYDDSFTRFEYDGEDRV